MCADVSLIPRHQFGCTEVANLEGAEVFGEEQVARFDVPVHEEEEDQRHVRINREVLFKVRKLESQLMKLESYFEKGC